MLKKDRIPDFFVDIKNIDHSIDIHIGLSYINNEFCDKNLYKSNIAYLDIQTANKLKRANEIAKSVGLRIRIYEGYRPYHITRKLNEIIKDGKEKGLLASNDGSWHNTGKAVDVTLIEKNGEELLMPTRCQEMNVLAKESNDNSKLLKKIMNEAGFVLYANEWWHFFDFFDKNGKKLDLKDMILYDFEI